MKTQIDFSNAKVLLKGVVELQEMHELMPKKKSANQLFPKTTI